MHQSTQISYEVHDSFTGLLSIVNNFIQQKDDEDFIGTWMTIANFEAPENGFVLNKVILRKTRRMLWSVHCYYILDQYFPRNYCY